METETPSVATAISRVMADMNPVGKDGYNSGQKFNFRGIDALMNACYAAMIQHGVFMVPAMEENKIECIEGKDYKGNIKKTFHALVVMRYRIYGPAGDYVEAVVPGEAMDSYDKATNKALSAALKYALVQTFMIPTDMVDGDSENPNTDSVEEPAPPAKLAKTKAASAPKATKQPEPEPDPGIAAITATFAQIEDPKKRASAKEAFKTNYEKDNGTKLELTKLNPEELAALLEPAQKLVEMTLSATTGEEN